MQNVAHHLQTHVVSASPPDRDQFARSAFNRYYYHCFLRTRETLGSLDDKWKMLPHADYSKVLAGAVVNRLNQQLRKSRKSSDMKLQNILSAAKRAARELSQLMETAYAVRITADYNPEVPIAFKAGSRFSLNNVDISEAHGWASKVDVYRRAIENAWRELDD